MKKLGVWTQIVAIALAGCATASKDIVPTAVSPMQYANYDCDQIAAEQRRIYARVGEVGGRLDQAASNDNTLAWSALLVWPTLFFLGGTKPQEAEYARLRGEYDALHQTAIMKKCAGALLTPPLQQAAPGAPAGPGATTPAVTAPVNPPALTPTVAPENQLPVK
jgi:hypothetical protein